MKTRIMIIGLTLLGLVVTFVMIHTYAASGVAARPVRLVISAPDGQRFSGSYIADGITNSITGLTPTTINLQARDVAFEFKREGTNADFRVAMYVGDLCRTSTTSDKRHGVRGELQYSADKEGYWAAAFD